MFPFDSVARTDSLFTGNCSRQTAQMFIEQSRMCRPAACLPLRGLILLTGAPWLGLDPVPPSSTPPQAGCPQTGNRPPVQHLTQPAFLPQLSYLSPPGSSLWSVGLPLAHTHPLLSCSSLLISSFSITPFSEELCAHVLCTCKAWKPQVPHQPVCRGGRPAPGPWIPAASTAPCSVPVLLRLSSGTLPSSSWCRPRFGPSVSIPT